MPGLSHRIGERLYRWAYPLYRFLYRGYKSRSGRAERRVLQQHVRMGDVVVDAGANIGVYSEFFSRLVGETGIVHCFEPSPQNFFRLKAATAGFSNIRASELALGATSGEAVLYVSKQLNVDHRTYSQSDELRSSIPIKIVALDDYLDPPRKVDFIKIDIQGYELHALRGAAQTLEQNSGVKLLLEFWPHGLKSAGVEPRALPEFLLNRGFTLFTFEKTGLRPFDFALSSKLEVDFYRNILALRERELDRH